MGLQWLILGRGLVCAFRRKWKLALRRVGLSGWCLSTEVSGLKRLPRAGIDGHHKHSATKTKDKALSSRRITMRIVSGTFRGRTLATPKDATRIRPTADRVRETIFNVLGQRCDGLSVLDLFAGTGALAFEALSRGADSAVLVDNGTEAIQLCRDNAKALRCEHQVQILKQNADDALASFKAANATFELVFADPPYALQWGLKALAQVAPLCAPGAVLVFEHAKSEPSPAISLHWQVLDVRDFGVTTVSMLSWQP
jgi:16S rRNA (guanine966-N2)-methyltransferase